MVDSYSSEELKVVILHERTHIRLGHLWFGLVWDVLRCLLWINPFLTVCQKHFKADMEDICDRVCIQNSGRTAHEYGMVLLKSLKLLCFARESTSPAATYVGERDFEDLKRRMQEIAGFRPYRKELCAGMAAAAFLVIMAVLVAVHTHSYARYNENEDIMVCKYDGEAAIVSHDAEDLDRMISYDDRYVYIDREAFEDFLHQNNADGEIYIYFGGFYKLPGLGSGAESCFYENASADEIIQLPYERMMDKWYFKLLKLL